MQAFAFDQLSAPAPAQEVTPSADEGAAEPGVDLAAVEAEARAAGFEAGRAEALAAVAPAVAALDSAVAELRAAQAELAGRLEEEAVELALAVAERVVSGVLEVEPERVVEAVRGALRGVTDRSQVIVFVNPDDLELVRDAAGALVAQLGGIEHLEVQAERRVGRGGAIVRHPEGDVDAQVATKLERARELAGAER